MILVIDNYDSFVHNLARYVREEDGDTLVVRNDECSAEDLLGRNPTGIVLSPGPGAPGDAGVCLELLKRAPLRTPVFGVCLGHQCLVESEGGAVVRARRPLHGEAAPVDHDGTGLLAGIPRPFMAGRYHSLIGETAPGGALRPNAWSAEGEIMGVRHESAPRHGVQFHPESLLTPHGRAIVRNFVRLTAALA
ncbi:MAG: aminodeoxychorismate/anthranilate synthase component II [Parvularculaceae bacterium]